MPLSTHLSPKHQPSRHPAGTSPFDGEGEMRALGRAFDWAATPLGPVESWSYSLRTTVATVLSSRNPMFLFWGRERIQIYNDAYRPSLGTGGRHPKALGMRGRDFWTDIWDAIGPQIEGAMTRGEATWHENQYLPIERDGHLDDAWWTYSYSPVRDDDGSICGTLVVCQETTERVETERSLQAISGDLEVEWQRLEFLFRSAPTYLAVFRGPGHVFEQVNEAYYQLVGHRELVGRPVWETLPEVRGQGFEKVLDGVLETGVPWVGREVPVMLQRTPNGPIEEAFVDVSYMPLIEADGTRAGIVAHGSEVTAQVRARREVERLLAESEHARAALAESESRFRAVQDASPDVSLLARAIRGRDGTIADFLFTYANDAVKPILLGRDEDVVGRTMREAFPDSVSAGRLDIYSNVAETGVPWQADVHYTRGDVAHGLRVTVVKVGDGVHIGAADLSDQFRVAVERERLLLAAESARIDAERARAAAEEANRAKAEFLATMSHELRTPLNAIGGYAELIELGIHGPVTPAQAEALRRLQSAQRHLLGLINDVLNYTRVEAGAVRYELESVPVSEVLATCEALVAPQMRQRKMNFALHGCGAHVMVRADREKTQQILLNLLTNATKFTAPGGSISISCESSKEAVLLSVTDTGRGIPADRLDSIFEPFVQVDARLTRSQEGVGLGLAISRDLARGMDGELTVRSTEGEGSTFMLRLPRAT